MPTARPAWILPAIVAAQLLATSLWFAPNAVLGELQAEWTISGGAGLVTAAVQLGFILGTLTFALLGIADRFRPGTVFLLAAGAGAAINVSILWFHTLFMPVLIARFLVGFCLAGVYPVGMRMAAGWYAGGLGRALGFLLAALVLGTALPHLLRALGTDWSWQSVLAGTSVLAVIAGILARTVPEGPHLARQGRLRFGGVFSALRVARFRAAAVGYLGHMWELYAFWAFIPLWLMAYGSLDDDGLALASFAVIAAGAFGCIGGGFLARRHGSGRVALAQLGTSGGCCLLSPLAFLAPPLVVAAFLGIWGLAVIGDSPQFSTLTAANAPSDRVGSALTLVNSAGFAMSMASLTLLEVLQHTVPAAWLFLALLPGPVAGLIAARALWLRDTDPDSRASAH